MSSTRIIKIYPENPHQRAVDIAVGVLKADGVISYPTDTIYGLGASIKSKSALERIYAIKKITETKLLSFLCRDIKQIAEYAYISNANYKILRRCLPGAFTFILPATNNAPKKLFQKRRTVGVRIPDSRLCFMLADTLGIPIISTSVPADSFEVLNDPLEIDARIGHQIDLILDGGILISEPSTIVDLSGASPMIIRKGRGDPSLIL
jgi:tRNA threonylcarbamoyl adenosine modification protein (Sua5/YciO/YrdC/YwlC family)